MAHAQWWQPGERDPRRRDVGAAWHEESVWLGEIRASAKCCSCSFVRRAYKRHDAIIIGQLL